MQIESAFDGENQVVHSRASEGVPNVPVVAVQVPFAVGSAGTENVVIGEAEEKRTDVEDGGETGDGAGRSKRRKFASIKLKGTVPSGSEQRR
jgi:hypothetical protein